jgi:hypothetical protein
VNSFLVTVQNGNASNCSIAVVFVRPTAPIVMTNGGFTLTYGVDFNGTNVMNIGAPSSGYYVTVAGGGSVTFNTYRMTISGSQTSAAAGSYSDTAVLLYLYAYRAGAWRFVRTYAMTFNATINKTCTMSAPSPATLNFTSAINNGVPNPAVVMTSTFTNINCTFPSRITLAGNAMQRVPAVGAIAGFDNFIDWQASATLGSATAVLATNAASTVTSTSTNVGSGTTVNGSFGVNVNLLAGQRLRSGTYSSVLTVTVDPTL